MQRSLVVSLLIVAAGTATARAAGTLTPVHSGQRAAEIVEHDVRVVLNNGFARTEVTQTFHNPNDVAIEAIYSFPIPASASLSEMSVYLGEREMHGEVLTDDEVDRIYGAERAKGNDAGKAEKNGLQSFDFFVAPVPAGGAARMRFVYYQPVPLDATVGRYTYPLQVGATDEAALRFWTDDDKVRGSFRFEIEMFSAVPFEHVRIPGFENVATLERLGDGHVIARIDLPDTQLNRDIVCYYRLPDDMPGQVELLTNKPDADEAGTFMLVVTPGIDLQPLENGSDFVFVLDVSGSMRSNLETLVEGVQRGLGKLHPDDRFRVVLFDDRSREITRGWESATVENIAACLEQVIRHGANGGTNMFAGLQHALQGLDPDRATSVVLVTDAATNTGVVDPKAFAELTAIYDVRVFGFLLGNGGNWPLMQLVCDASGGFWQRVSNADDVYGQILLAQGKLTHECMHGAKLTIDGVDVFDTSETRIGKVYHGEQIVVFGRYNEGGTAEVALHATLTGEDRIWRTSFDFPDVSVDYPEIERLWALEWIEGLEAAARTGLIRPDEAAGSIADLGVRYQLVTDETSMVVLPDETFAEYGIARSNAARIAEEAAAQHEREVVQPSNSNYAPRSNRVDRVKPMFDRNVPRPGGSGGGAISPLGLGLLLIPLALARRGTESVTK